MEPLSPELEQIRAELHAASSRAQRILANLGSELVGRRPDPSSWSVAECIAHLSLTTDAYLPEIRAALDDARRQNLTRSARPFRMDLVSRLLSWWLEPPYRMKSRTSAAFVPGPGRSVNPLPDFLEGQQELLRLLTDANGLALDRLRIASPFARQMRYNVYSAFRLVAVHQRRHLWQAEQTAQRVSR